MHKRATKPKSAAPAAPTVISNSARIPTWLVATLLALVTIVIYWPATRHDFVQYDDDIFVTANAHVQKGLSWENLRWACANPVNCIWHPLTTLSHMADCQLFGLQPWGHHLTSILLHAINTMLVFLFLRGLTGAFWRSVLVAMLFGFHPSHVESVAWVAERKDVLSACCGLLALIFYGRYAQRRKALEDQTKSVPAFIKSTLTSGNYWLALLWFALGLLSKPMLVTWPFVMLLLDFWPLERFRRGNIGRLVIEKIPLFALTILASIVAYETQKQGGALTASEVLPVSTRLGNSVVSLCRYVGMQLWPVNLSVFYPHPGHWPTGTVLLAGILVVCISVWLFMTARKCPFMLAGWLWFCGTMVPVIGLVQLGEQSIADRYCYLPSLGFWVCSIWGVCLIARDGRRYWFAWSAVGALAVILCGGLTRQQLAHWQNTNTLFRHALAVTKNNHIALFQVGTGLLAEGHVDDALSHFKEAIRLRPDYADAHNNLGTALGMKGQLDEAINEFREAIRLKPNFAFAHNNLGHALGIKGEIDPAISELEEALRLTPDYPEAHYHLGTAFLAKNDVDAAINHFRASLKFAPKNADTHNSLGAALYTKGDLDAAINQFQEVLRLKPGHAGASNNLSNALELKAAQLRTLPQK